MMTQKLSWYSALVHFKNMGSKDNLFDSSVDSYGGYSCLYAKVDQEKTFKKLIENYATAYKTHIISIEKIQKRTNFTNDDADKLIHYLGIHNDRVCSYSEEEKNTNERIYKYKKLKPIWRSADVLVKKTGPHDRLFSFMPPESEIGKIHVLSKTSAKYLFVKLIKNYISTYNSKIIAIENITTDENIDNKYILLNKKVQWMGIYGDGTIQDIE